MMASEDDERHELAAVLKRAMGTRVETLPKPKRGDASASRGDRSRSGKSISFNTELLRAVLSGSKTQTRRPIRPMPADVRGGVPFNAQGQAIKSIACVGQPLTVRESCARRPDGSFVYAIDRPTTPGVRWQASRFMPRDAARTSLDVRSVAVERLSAIDDAAALAEGAAADPSSLMFGPRAWFLTLWDSIYGETEFASANDPWVWAVTFALNSE